ncbi:MAG: ABC transporter permease [Planctomycetota bacterium]
MIRFLIYRMLWVAVTVWVVATISFFLVRAAPGDPFMNEMRSLSPTTKKAKEKEFNLDQPLFWQYAFWMGNAVRGDFGPSMKYQGKSVADIIAQSFPVSLALGSIAMVISIVFGMASGVLAALRQNSAWDYGLTSIAILGISIPNFILAILFIVLFVFVFNFFPLSGFETYSQVVLPAFALGLPFAARISRLTRVGMLEVLSEDFIRTAHAKGLMERHVVVKHALRGAILPVVSFLGPAFALILTGSLVIEKIFFIPGLGKIFVQAAVNRDYNVVLGTVVVFSVLVCIFNFLVDLSYAFLDPRVKLEDAA